MNHLRDSSIFDMLFFECVQNNTFENSLFLSRFKGVDHQ